MNEKKLKSILMRQDGPTLRKFLLALAADYPDIDELLQRLPMAAQSDLVAKEFACKLNSFYRAGKYYSLREVNGFAQELQIWIDQVGRELLSIDPRAAAMLFESFIECDTKWFEMADDSGGHIGGVMSAACQQWLRAARLCAGPIEVWANRLESLYLADRYGAREELMRKAKLLLNDAELQQMINRLEGHLCGIPTFRAKRDDEVGENP